MIVASLSSAASSDLFQWVRASANGTATLDHRQRLTTAGGDSGVRGMFATAPIPNDTLILWVPDELIIFDESGRDGPGGTSHCGLIEKLRHELELGSESTVVAPFMEYLHENQLSLQLHPEMWSPRVRALVERVPPYDFGRHLSWWALTCGGDASDKLAVRSALLTVTRSVGYGPDGTYLAMVPVYDLYNHVKAAPRHNTRASTRVRGEGMSMWTTRDIEAGEELKHDYTEAQQRHTPEVFRDYGFVEQRPQQWWFYDAACAHHSAAARLADPAAANGCTQHRFTLGAAPAQGEQEPTSVVAWHDADGMAREGMARFAAAAEGARALLVELESALFRASEMLLIMQAECTGGQCNEQVSIEEQQVKLVRGYLTSFRGALQLALASVDDGSAVGAHPPEQQHRRHDEL